MSVVGAWWLIRRHRRPEDSRGLSKKDLLVSLFITVLLVVTIVAVSAQYGTGNVSNLGKPLPVISGTQISLRPEGFIPANSILRIEAYSTVNGFLQITGLGLATNGTLIQFSYRQNIYDHNQLTFIDYDVFSGNGGYLLSVSVNANNNPTKPQIHVTGVIDGPAPNLPRITYLFSDYLETPGLSWPGTGINPSIAGLPEKPLNGIVKKIASSSQVLGYLQKYDSGYLQIPWGSTSLLFSFSSDNLHVVDIYFSPDGMMEGFRITLWVGGTDDITHVFSLRGPYVRMVVTNTGLRVNGQTGVPSTRMSASIHGSTLIPATTWYRTLIIQNATYTGAQDVTLFPYMRGPWGQATGVTYGIQYVLYAMGTMSGENAQINCWLKYSSTPNTNLQASFQPCVAGVGVTNTGTVTLNFPGETNWVLPDALTDPYGKLGLTLTGTNPRFTGVDYLWLFLLGP